MIRRLYEGINIHEDRLTFMNIHYTLLSFKLQDFDQAVLSMKHSGALVLMDGPLETSSVSAKEDGQIVLVKKSFNKHTTFYSQMFEPFLLAYWVRLS